MKRYLYNSGVALEDIDVYVYAVYLSWGFKFIPTHISTKYRVGGGNVRNYVLVAALCGLVLHVLLIFTEFVYIPLFTMAAGIGQSALLWMDCCMDVVISSTTRETPSSNILTTTEIARGVGYGVGMFMGTVIYDAGGISILYMTTACIATLLLLVNYRYLKDVVVPSPDGTILDSIRDTYIFFSTRTEVRRILLFVLLLHSIPSHVQVMFWYTIDVKGYTNVAMGAIDLVSICIASLILYMITIFYEAKNIYNMFFVTVIISVVSSVLLPITITEGGFDGMNILNILPSILDGMNNTLMNIMLLVPLKMIVLRMSGTVTYSITLSILNTLPLVSSLLNKPLIHLLKIEHDNFHYITLYIMIVGAMDIVPILVMHRLVPRKSVIEIVEGYISPLDPIVFIAI